MVGEKNVQVDQDFTWTWRRGVDFFNLGGDRAGLVVDACFVLLWYFCRHGDGWCICVRGMCLYDVRVVQ